MAAEQDAEIVSLEVSRAMKFLDTISTAPFLCLVVTSEGVKMFDAEITPEHLKEIRAFIKRKMEGG